MEYVPSAEDAQTLAAIAEQDVWDDERDQMVECLLATPEEVDLFACDSTIEFGERVCGFVPNEAQRALGLPWYDPLQAKIWASVDAHSNTIVFSGNGIGKTMAIALDVLRHYYAGWAIATTAPVKRQVENLWSEIRTLKEMAAGRGVILPGRWSPRAHHVELSPKWTMSGYTARVATGETISAAFSGKHYSRMYGAMDELVGVAQPIWQAMATLLVGPRDKFLGAGNPHNPSAYAASAAKEKYEDGTHVYNVLHLSSEDHSNVRHDQNLIPGATSRKFIALQLAKGGSRESAIFRSTVLGLFPNQAEDALIRVEWIEAAKFRGELRVEDEKQFAFGKRVGHVNRRRFPIDHKGVALGLDVAGEGRDLTVLMACENAKLFFPKLLKPNGDTLPCWHRGRDHTEATELLVQAIKQIPRVLSVSIDDTGLGAAVSAELWKRSQKEFPEIPIFITKGPLASPSEMRTKCAVTRINFGMRPAGKDAEIFGAMKDSLWWTFREALREDKVHLPTEPEQRECGFPEKSDLFAQIIAPIMWQDTKGKMHILDKQSAFGGMGKEVSKFLPTLSPDIAHSAILAWWAWSQLPERYAAPENPIELQQVQKDATIAAAMPHAPGAQQDQRRPFQRRAR